MNSIQVVVEVFCPMPQLGIFLGAVSMGTDVRRLKMEVLLVSGHLVPPQIAGGCKTFFVASTVAVRALIWLPVVMVIHMFAKIDIERRNLAWRSCPTHLSSAIV